MPHGSDSGYWEYMDIDRDTTSEKETPNSIARRWVDTTEFGMPNGRTHWGSWKPTKNAKAILGHIVHKNELRNDDAPPIKQKVLRLLSSKIDRLQRELEEKAERLKNLKGDIDFVTRELDKAQAKQEKLTGIDSLMKFLVEAHLEEEDDYDNGGV